MIKDEDKQACRLGVSFHVTNVNNKDIICNWSRSSDSKEDGRVDAPASAIRETQVRKTKVSFMKNYRNLCIQQPQVKEEYHKVLTKSLENTEVLKEIEEQWKHVKSYRKEAAKKTCGVTRRGNRQGRRTAWWTTDIKIVKEKKLRGTTQERNDKETTEQGDIAIEELRNAVQKIRNRKTLGHDGVAAEMIKALSELGCEILINLLNHIKKKEEDSQRLANAML
ncbi:hypothetical protein ILUMI_13162 [Ignelater luminosus]|uniref:Uncharacterized protein n=1 Tax=Ignelater luminosus TaxID=2038154 RepID=A0A8K0CX65_IGNLU|nr:hypothetical protein ILUMI_13162 [Ignelater luminosus]